MKYTKKQIIDFLASQKNTFEKEYHVRKIGIFGSYARGEATDDSDIDIVVELDKPDMFYLIGIKQSVEEAFGVNVDIIRLRERMNKVLREQIEKDAIYV